MNKKTAVQAGKLATAIDQAEKSAAMLNLMIEEDQPPASISIQFDIDKRRRRIDLADLGNGELMDIIQSLTTNIETYTHTVTKALADLA